MDKNKEFKVCKYNSNKSPTRCNSFAVYYPDVYLQLNMFRAFSRPSSGAQWLQWQPLVLPSYRGDSRAVFVVGPVITGPTTNTAQNCCIWLEIYLNWRIKKSSTSLRNRFREKQRKGGKEEIMRSAGSWRLESAEGPHRDEFLWRTER